MRHTALTRTKECGTNRWVTAGLFGLTINTIESAHGYHHPNHLKCEAEALDRRFKSSLVEPHPS